MLQSISWYQFLYAIGGAVGIYYVGAIVYFYSEELKALLRGDLSLNKLFNFRRQPHEVSRSEDGHTVMGETSDFSSEANDDSLIGTVSDLVDEIKAVTSRTQSLPTEEAESLFRNLLKKYPKLIGTHYQPTISLFIADSLTDKTGKIIERKDVHNWWPSSELGNMVNLFQEKGKAIAIAILVYMLLPLIEASAQDGNAGINEATMRVRSFFATGVNLTYAIGAIIGLIGAVKVYQKWNSGDQDTGKVAASWFGSCVFLVITATVLRSFFGV